MEISKEAEASIATSSMFPGFRFSPTDEELILYYLKKKVEGFDKCVEIIPELDICNYEPWDLPAMSIIKSDREWFFFSPRGKKYPSGSQSRRATEIGYWKATGKERGVKSGSDLVGTKRTLVFHIGRAPKGERTEWIMHEYCMAGMVQDSLVICRLRRKTELQDGLSPRSLSMIHGHATSSGGALNISGGEKATCSKKSSSSHDSHSVEQTDDASVSDHKLKDDVVQPESSNHPTLRGNAEDDWFADILNDNIVELDSLSPGPDQQSSVPSTSGLRIIDRQLPAESTMGHLSPPQGTANRRMRLTKLRRPYNVELSVPGSPEGDKATHVHHSDGKAGHPPSLTLMMRLKEHPNRLYMVVTITSLVILFLTLLGYCWQASRFVQSAFPTAP
ncbi:hypothetical protein Ancab_007517 [Ancistrocladus abbreviatus]